MYLKNQIKKIKNKTINYPKYLINKKFIDQLKPYNNLIIKDDRYNWVLKSISKEMEYILNKLNINLLEPGIYDFINKQCEFNLSKFDALLNFDKNNSNKKAFPYFHGLPENHPKNFECIKSLKKNHEYFSKIQVTNQTIKNLLLETGIDENKIHKILISIDYDLFNINYDKNFINSERKKYNIPLNSFVIGSFQKDGQSWNSGNKPKYSKGPDILIKSLKLIHQKIPETFVLISGPSRGYVIKELIKNNIPYKYLYLEDYKNIPALYALLNLYIVTSREEGGPRAILESMAAGIPIISSKVGQAEELIKEDYNGWLTEIGDIDNILDKTNNVYLNKKNNIIINNAKKTAEANSYKNQIEQWKFFFEGFIE